ncbi:MAG: aldose 1-epimerase [Flavobacteriaceae bacterium]|nr:aldose 1-epimerase [Flavobacteriaceae bacterium]
MKYSVDITKENSSEIVVLENTSKTSKATIVLNEGARVKDLTFDNITVIQEQQNFDYKDSYASSILFPFVSRIKNGIYTFQENTYQLECNNDKNALHGLVYNKPFQVFDVKEQKNSCSVTLNYNENNLSKGFPFTYLISVTYTLLKDELKINIAIKNTDKKKFPFTLGWHPYFFVENISNSTIAFDAAKKVVFDENLITKDIEDYQNKKSFKIEDKKLDDCFFLVDNCVSFSTDSYKISIASSVNNNYLQLYTPANRKLIAIEPMTGISNSFNNKIGLQTLDANETFNMCWNVSFTNLLNHE